MPKPTQQKPRPLPERPDLRHLKDEAKSLTARAKAIVAAKNNPLQEQTVDVMELRRQ